MRTQALRIELLEDCVFSARSATAGAHESLDRVPGQALLGAAAARLYGELGPASAFEAFHSGRVRFTDGLPLVDETVAHPVALCWHSAKNDTIKDDDNRLRADAIVNFVHDSALPDNRQPAQLRSGYVRGDGLHVIPERTTRLKTAIDPATGHAAEGQLFGYDALARGQGFLAHIEADADVDAALFEAIVAALQGERLLGRSRSAEYGRARINAVDADDAVEASVAPAPSPQRHLTLWLLSDLALLDEAGEPTLQPRPEYLGLGSGRIDWQRTFLRSRRYSPWNAHRNGFERERAVLTAGGVITLELDEAPSSAACEALQHGVGLHTEAGLGRMAVNPGLLATRHPEFDAAMPKASPDRTPERPKDPLLDWLEAQAGQVKARTRVEEVAAGVADDYRTTLRTARRYNGVADTQPFGPTRSQWGQVRTKARELRGDDLHKALFKGKGAVIDGDSGENWQEKFRDSDGRETTLGKWLQQRLEGTELRDRNYSEMVARVADRLLTAEDRAPGAAQPGE